MADTDPVVDPTVDDEIEEDIPEPVSGSLIKGVCVPISYSNISSDSNSIEISINSIFCLTYNGSFANMDWIKTSIS